MSELFTLNRFLLLVRNEIVTNYRKWLTTSGAIAFGIFVTAVLFGRNNPDFYLSWYVMLIFIMGIFISSRAFKELHDKTTNESYLLVPSSSLEKTLAKLFIVTVGFVIYLVVFLIVSSVIVETILWLILNRDFSLFNPFSKHLLVFTPLYLFVQSFYFLGAAWFKKMQLAKTTLGLSLVNFGFFLLGLLMIRIFFSSYFANAVDTGLLAELIVNLFEHPFFWIVKIIGILIPPACWFIACKRVEEAQVSDGI